MLRIRTIAPDSIGHELGLVPGTQLLAVNGRSLEDFLDWEFLTAEDRFLLAARLPSGEDVEYDIERPEGFPMGVTLEPPRIGDLLEQPGIGFKYVTFARSRRFEIVPDHLFAALLIQDDSNLVEPL